MRIKRLMVLLVLYAYSADRDINSLVEKNDQYKSADNLLLGGDFGHTVALSDDGNTGLIGASWKGAAYVFAREGAGWTQHKKLIPSDGTSNDRFGHSVALSNSDSIPSASTKDSTWPGTGSVLHIMET